MTDHEILESLPAKVSIIVKGPGTTVEKLKAICRQLSDDVAVYDWVGFYMVDPQAHRELVLGPYVGAPTDHIRIPFGTGICGQAAETLETFIVDDVNAQSNYLSCSIHVKSEIVVPIMKGATLIGELDIDSNILAAFSDKDREVLEEICRIVATMY